MSAPVQLVVVTGLSGAGRSTAAKCLEDLGWFVVDNLPPALLAPMLELGTRVQGEVDRIAVVADVRSRAFSADLRGALDEVGRRGVHARVLFFEAADEALVQRFDSVRRPHPLQGDGGLVDGIARERQLLRELRGEADLVLDCRFLPNPHWVPELRHQTGLDPAVRDHVLGEPGAGEFLDRAEGLLRLLFEGYVREGKRYALLAVGCTGGKHRSVAMAERLVGRLSGPGVDAAVVHRDLGRE